MESDAVYNSPEEVIVNDREKSIPRVYQEYTKSIPRVYWNLTLFSLNDSYFHPENLKLVMVTQIQRVGESRSLASIEHYPDACD